MPVIQSSAAWLDYDIPGSPYFVYVEAGQVTGEGSATTWPQVRDLMGPGSVRQSRRPVSRPAAAAPGRSWGDGPGRGERDNLRHAEPV